MQLQLLIPKASSVIQDLWQLKTLARHSVHISQVATSKSAPNYGQNFKFFSQTHHTQHPEHSGKDEK